MPAIGMKKKRVRNIRRGAAPIQCRVSVTPFLLPVVIPLDSATLQDEATARLLALINLDPPSLASLSLRVTSPPPSLLPLPLLIIPRRVQQMKIVLVRVLARVAVIATAISPCLLVIPIPKSERGRLLLFLSLFLLFLPRPSSLLVSI